MRHDRRRADQPNEPGFDLPPVLGSIERRAGGRAAALWSEQRGERPMPSAARYESETAQPPFTPFGAHSVMVDLLDEATVVAVGDIVGPTFGLRPGRLVAGDGATLSDQLLEACGTLRRCAAIVDFEGKFTVGADRPATLLTRGVVLPLADDHGGLMRAHAVITWKELLSPVASADLRRELGLVFARRAYH